MINSHYIPKFILKQFGEKICTYDIKEGIYNENVNPKDAFCLKGFYSDEIEKKLNEKIEKRFAKLFYSKINIDKKTLTFNRTEIKLIKKFLLIMIIRSIGSEDFLQKEKYFYEIINEKLRSMLGNEYKNEIKPPFQEKEIKNESSFDYWMRTLNAILDSDGSPNKILDHEMKTFPAYRWAKVINNGYLAFWDSEYTHNEFIISDVGMTSENEIGCGVNFNQNIIKTNYLLDLYKNINNNEFKQIILKTLIMEESFHENFMMFPISAKRMIVLICPFFKFRIETEKYLPKFPLNKLTMIPNEALFYPNNVKYKNVQKSQNIILDENDNFFYEIKQLSDKETQYCNMLFLDRINKLVGFSSLNKLALSFIKYSKLKFKRVDYSKLYEKIDKTFQRN